MLDANPTAAHHLIASLIWTIRRMIKKHPQTRNGSSNGISTLLLGKTYEDAVRAAVDEMYLLTTRSERIPGTQKVSFEPWEIGNLRSFRESGKA